MKLWKQYLLIGLACLLAAPMTMYLPKDYVYVRYRRAEVHLGVILLYLGAASPWLAYDEWKREKKREAKRLAKQQHYAAPQAPSTQPKRPPARQADIRYRIASLVLVGLLLFVVLSGLGRWGLFD